MLTKLQKNKYWPDYLLIIYRLNTEWRQKQLHQPHLIYFIHKIFKSLIKVALYDYLSEAQQTEALVAQKVILKWSEE